MARAAASPVAAYLFNRWSPAGSHKCRTKFCELHNKQNATASLLSIFNDWLHRFEGVKANETKSFQSIAVHLSIFGKDEAVRWNLVQFDRACRQPVATKLFHHDSSAARRPSRRCAPANRAMTCSQDAH